MDTLISAFSQETWAIVWPAVSQTLYMTVFTTLLTGIFGLLLGIVLVLTEREGLCPKPYIYAVISSIINGLRSLPSIIVIILTLPLSKLIIGISYGPKACIIALSVSCIPMFARLVQNSIAEVPMGKIEAAKSMGAQKRHIILKVMLPEALPVIIRNFIVTIIAVISTTALAGAFGAGGLGDVAVRYGYSRFKGDILIASVFALILMVQFIQLAGDFLVTRILKKRHLI